jgi:hypothetical protein
MRSRSSRRRRPRCSGPGRVAIRPASPPASARPRLSGLGSRVRPARASAGEDGLLTGRRRLSGDRGADSPPEQRTAGPKQCKSRGILRHSDQMKLVTAQLALVRLLVPR